MKAILVVVVIAALVVLVLFLRDGPVSSGLVEGGLYAVALPQGGFQLVKVLKNDKEGSHLRVYSNIVPSVPASVQEADLVIAGLNRKPGESFGIGHCPVGNKALFAWDFRAVQVASVSDGELVGYRQWLDGKGGYFNLSLPEIRNVIEEAVTKSNVNHK